jgi:TPR repeat protein
VTPPPTRFYSDDEGATYDLKEAAKWFHRAAEQGHRRAQINLGMMYDRGEGVARDKTKAVKWFSLAASYGEADAEAMDYLLSK